MNLGKKQEDQPNLIFFLSIYIYLSLSLIFFRRLSLDWSIKRVSIKLKAKDLRSLINKFIDLFVMHDAFKFSVIDHSLGHVVMER